MRIADELQVDCPVIYIDNVAEYFTRQGSLDMTRDLPNVAPPLSDAFFEYRWIRDGKCGSDAWRVRAGEFTAAEHDAAKCRFDCRWFLRCQHIWRNDDGKLVLGKHLLWVHVGDDGLLSVVGVDSQSSESDLRLNIAWLMPVLLSISFMHCKNVRHVENTPRGIEAKRAAKMGKPLLKFYTLEIDPMKETLRREGNVETVGLPLALHRCRGHFKDYRQSGLFGKIKGIFWWGPALRGAAENGVVIKDYAVKAPDEATVH
jgi:hypothetical protein